MYPINFFIRRRYRTTKVCKDWKKRNVVICPNITYAILPEPIMDLEGFKRWWYHFPTLWWGNAYQGIGKFSLVNKSKNGHWHRVAKFQVKVDNRQLVFIGDFHRLEIALGYRGRKAEKLNELLGNTEPKPKPVKKQIGLGGRIKGSPGVFLPTHEYVEYDYDDDTEEEWDEEDGSEDYEE